MHELQSGVCISTTCSDETQDTNVSVVKSAIQTCAIRFVDLYEHLS